MRVANGIMQRLAIRIVLLQRRKIGNNVFVRVMQVVPAGGAFSNGEFHVRRNAVFMGLKQQFRNHANASERKSQ